MRGPLFRHHGAHVLVDGQFGSTGKGALAAWLAHQAKKVKWNCDAVLSNAGPNSGHTFYHEDEKHVLKQLPTFAVASHLLGNTIPVYLTAGAIIDPDILRKEAEKYPEIPIYVHDCAAVIRPEEKEAEHSGPIKYVAGTRSGTGAAIARKVLREHDAVWGGHGAWHGMAKNVFDYSTAFNWTANRLFVEVSQGFSLGLNESRFYPKTTSRECTVSQALSDARLPPAAVSRTYMTLRTYPIRVGNVDGYSSGGCYPDQEETTWEKLGQEAELTTVTQRVRRVFTFSEIQAIEALNANAPDFVFLNFMNYLTDVGERDILETMDHLRNAAPQWFDLILGYGAKVKDVVEA